MDVRIALLGSGSVGWAVAAAIAAPEQPLSQASPILVACHDSRCGGVFDPDGIDAWALTTAARTGSFGSLVAATSGWDATAVAAIVDYDVLVELSAPDPRSGEAATSRIQLALERGRCACTTNSAAAELHRARLDALAARHGGAWACIRTDGATVVQAVIDDLTALAETVVARRGVRMQVPEPTVAGSIP